MRQLGLGSCHFRSHCVDDARGAVSTYHKGRPAFPSVLVFASLPRYPHCYSEYQATTLQSLHHDITSSHAFLSAAEESPHTLPLSSGPLQDHIRYDSLRQSLYTNRSHCIVHHLGPSLPLQEQHCKSIVNMTSTLPNPPQGARLPRNDSFSTEDITRAFKASATKPRNNLSLSIVKHDETSPPPPSPLDSRPASSFGLPERRR